jgi:hypothetical protein
MKELLTTYTIEQIIIFLFMIAVALKEGIELFKYFRDLIKNKNIEDINENNKGEIILKEIQEIKEELQIMRENYDSKFDSHSEKLDILIGSDREDIRAFIVSKHHFHTEHEHWIDDYTMDVLEKRYAYYKEEGGNSYIGQLMNEIRALPKHPPKTRLKE